MLVLNVGYITYDIPITTKTAKTKLSKLQWHNRNKILGNKKLKIKASNNARGYYTQLARQHSRIANIRQDTTQKMTTDISRKAYVIRIEDLNVQGMITNHKLAQAVSNNCFYEIRRQLTYKQSHYGTKVELVDRWFPSSKMCSSCGHIQPMGLSERVYNCGSCSHAQDRDENASVNLMNAPNAIAGIADYWILDVNQRQVYVFRKPGLEGYNLKFILQEDATLSLIAFPEIEVKISQMFP